MPFQFRSKHLTYTELVVSECSENYTKLSNLDRFNHHRNCEAVRWITIWLALSWTASGLTAQAGLRPHMRGRRQKCKRPCRTRTACDHALALCRGACEQLQPAMAWAVEHGIITGMTATTIVPQGTATRAQCAAMLMRFVEL